MGRNSGVDLNLKAKCPRPKYPVVERGELRVLIESIFRISEVIFGVKKCFIRFFGPILPSRFVLF